MLTAIVPTSVAGGAGGCLAIFTLRSLNPQRAIISAVNRGGSFEGIATRI